MNDSNSRMSRAVRIGSKWRDSVTGLIGFLDNIRIWELAGDIPPQFYTFPTMWRVLSLALSFSTIIALIGNAFEIAEYFIGANLTPVWYGIVFAFFFLRYYGSFGSFGINVYRTVISTTIISLFVMDNLLRNGLAYVGQLLKYSAFPDFAEHLPSYGIHYYHIAYFAVLFMPKKQRREGYLETKPLYSSKVVEIDRETYDLLVDAGLGDDTGDKTTYTPDYDENEKAEGQGVDTSSNVTEELKKLVRNHIDTAYDVFLWGKKVYVSKEFVDNSGISTNSFRRIRILQDGELKREGDYLILYASEVLDRSLKKKVMKERMGNGDKRNMYRNLKVEVLS